MRTPFNRCHIRRCILSSLILSLIVLCSLNINQSQALTLDDETYQQLFFEKSDLPYAMRMVQDSRTQGPDPNDRVFEVFGGQQSGFSVWMGSAHATVWRVVDVRSVFPNEEAARGYHGLSLNRSSEGFEEIKGAPSVGEDSHAYGGSSRLTKVLGKEIKLCNYFYLFRLGRVVVKLYVAQGTFARDGSLNLSIVHGLAERIAARAKKVLHTEDARRSQQTTQSGNEGLPEVIVQAGHAGTIHATAFSPDGTLLASGGTDHAIKLWDLRVFRQMRSFSGHRMPVDQVLFSHDGKRLYSGSSDGTMRFWDVSSGRELFSHGGHKPSVGVLTESPDGSLLAVAGQRGSTLYLFDVQRRQLMRSLVVVGPEERGGINSITFSPDGTLLLIGCTAEPADMQINNRKMTGEVKIWVYDLQGLQERPPILFHRKRGEPDGTISRILFETTGTRVAVQVSSERYGNTEPPPGSVYVFEFSTRKALFSLQGDDIGSLDEGLMITDRAKRPTIRDWQSGAVRWEWSGANWPYNINLSPNQRYLASDGNQIRIWDRTSSQLIRTLPSFYEPSKYAGNMQRYMAVAASPTEPLVASAGIDGLVRLWDLRDITRPRIVARHGALVESLAFSPDGTILASGGAGVQLTDVRKGALLQKLDAGARSLAFSSDGRLLATGGATVILWDVMSGRQLRKFIEGNSPFTVAFSRDNQRMFAVRLFTGEFSEWEIASGHRIRIEQLPGGGFTDSLLSVDSHTVLLGSGESSLLSDSPALLMALDPTRYRVMRILFGHRGRIMALALHPEGKIVASGGDDGTVRLWSGRLGLSDEVARFSGHASVVSSVAFSHDGRLLVSGSHDNSVRLWDVKKQAPVAMLVGFGESDHVVTTADNHYVASQGGLRSVALRLGDRMVPFERYDLQLSRPDIVSEQLGYADPELIASYRQLVERRLSKFGLSAASLSADYHLPQLSLLSQRPPLTTAAQSLHVSLRAEDSRYELKRLMVWVNDVPFPESRGIDLEPLHSQRIERELEIPLGSGRNKIELSAINAQGTESLRETLEVFNTSVSRKPRRYVLAVGVADYADNQLDLEYAAKDARDLSTLLQRPSPLFEETKVLLLTDKNATRDQILAARQFLQQSKIDDQVIVFFSGHGLLDQKYNYFFAPVDFELRDAARRGLHYEAIEGLLDGIAARRKLLLLDTCQSGEVDLPVTTSGTDAADVASGLPPGVRIVLPEGAKALRVLKASNTDELLRPRRYLGELFANLRRSSGTQIIVSASAAEYAFESRSWKNGIFTFALLDGLDDKKADLNKDGQIQVSELQRYVAARVQALSLGEQTPMFRQENFENDFVLY